MMGILQNILARLKQKKAIREYEKAVEDYYSEMSEKERKALRKRMLENEKLRFLLE